MWGKKYVYAGMTQVDLRKSQNEIQDHNNPTDAVYSFNTNFNFNFEQVGWCWMILFREDTTGALLENQGCTALGETSVTHTRVQKALFS